MNPNPQKLIQDELHEKGIVMLDCPFDTATLARWNKILDPLFAAQGNILRSYVSPPDLLKLGIFNEYWTPAMRSLVRSVIPDAVIETFDCYENAGGQNEADMYDEVNSEWHRDIADMPGVVAREPFYCSIFIYLSDVNDDSGGFEIRPMDPAIPLKDKDPVINVRGKAGTMFLWNRSFYHRASMNRAKTRRRVLKLSVQHNYLENASLISGLFATTKAAVAGDPYLSFLLGGSHSATHSGYLLPEVENVEVASSKLQDVNAQASTGAARQLYRRARRIIKRRILGIKKK